MKVRWKSGALTFVAVADDLIGIDGVGEDGVEIAAAAADEVGPNVLATAVELMADHAVAVEDVWDEVLYVVGGIFPGTEDFACEIADGLVLEDGEGAADGNGEAGGPEFVFGDGVQHGLSSVAAGSEGFDGGEARCGC